MFQHKLFWTTFFLEITNTAYVSDTIHMQKYNEIKMFYEEKKFMDYQFLVNDMSKVAILT